MDELSIFEFLKAEGEGTGGGGGKECSLVNF